MFIPVFKLVVILGAWLSPNSMQGKKVGVMYSAEAFGLTILESIVQSKNAGECAQGTLYFLLI